MQPTTSPSPQRLSPLKRLKFLAIATLTLALTACDQVTTNQYEATATVTYTWQVEYTRNPDNTNTIRRERFASTSLVNRNGERPGEAVTGPDDKGLWYPAIPERPTVDELEQRQKPQETIGTPELLKGADYSITYQADGQTLTAPTNYDVYRTVVKALPEGQSLQLTLGADDRFVQKADPR
jgi:hypothetical protein